MCFVGRGHLYWSCWTCVWLESLLKNEKCCFPRHDYYSAYLPNHQRRDRCLHDECFLRGVRSCRWHRGLESSRHAAIRPDTRLHARLPRRDFLRRCRHPKYADICQSHKQHCSVRHGLRRVLSKIYWHETRMHDRLHSWVCMQSLEILVPSNHFCRDHVRVLK